MTTGDGLRSLAELVDTLDTTDVDVLDVAVADGDGTRLVADLRVEVPVGGAVGPAAVAASVDRSGDADGDDDAGDEDEDVDDGDAVGAGTDRAGAAADEGGTTADDGTGDEATASTMGAGADGSDDPDEAEAAVGCRAADCDATFETEHGMKIHHTKVHGPSTADDQPAYRDPDRLREAYEAHDSFAAMREALGVDVSAQTVRRNAMRHGIHEPGGRDGGTGDGEDGDGNDGAAESPESAEEPAGTEEVEREQTHGTEGDQVGSAPAGDSPEEEGESAVDGGRVADADGPAGRDGTDSTGDSTDSTGDSTDSTGDGTDSSGADQSLRSLRADLPDVDLPDGVDLGDVKAAVESASTLYEVQRALDLDRERATGLLRDLGLLELVHGRVATKRRRDDLKEEIDQRIRERAASG